MCCCLGNSIHLKTWSRQYWWCFKVETVGGPDLDPICGIRIHATRGALPRTSLVSIVFQYSANSYRYFGKTYCYFQYGRFWRNSIDLMTFIRYLKIPPYFFGWAITGFTPGSSTKVCCNTLWFEGSMSIGIPRR